VVAFFRELTSPKSLLVQVGDHGMGELQGLAGLPAKPTAMTYRWMDHHLGGHSGIGPEPLFGVRSEYMHNVASDLHHDSWDAYALPATQFCLTGTVENTRDGRMVPDAPQTDWTTSLRAGVPTEAMVAPELVNTGGQERLGRPHIYSTAEIDREHAWVWNSAPLERAMRVQGDLYMRITVTAQAETATIIAYLFDYNPATRKAAIITSAPYTFHNGSPGVTRTAEFSLQPAHYVLQQGHQLQLIIDSKDRFFADATVDDTTLQASSPANAHSYISIPLQQLP
jgi:predicted acyl esterase